MGGRFRRGWGRQRSERDVGLDEATGVKDPAAPGAKDMARLLLPWLPLPRLLQAVRGYCCRGYFWHGYDCCDNCRKFAAIAATATAGTNTIAAATTAAALRLLLRLLLPGPMLPWILLARPQLLWLLLRRSLPCCGAAYPRHGDRF